MLHGFTIANFRNFGTDAQWIAPLGRVNVFIGTNNSGKSNILRYVRRVITPALSSDRNSAIKIADIDQPRGGRSAETFDLLVPFKTASILPGRRWEASWTTALKAAKVLNDDESFLTLTISLQSTGSGKFGGTVPKLKGPDAGAFQTLWHAMTGANGGDYEHHWFPEVMNRLVGREARQGSAHYISSFRQIPTRMSQFSDEYPIEVNASNHIIDQLASLAYPSYTEQHKKDEFEKLRRFIGDIIDDRDVLIEIPNDRSTINIKTGGNFLPIEVLGSGIHEVFMLAAELVLRSDQTILLEEPEVHLHPHLQRRFMRFVIEQTKNQIFMTTHSASIIDTEGASVFGVTQGEFGKVAPLITAQERFRACREIGLKASDLLQTNCVIWVEGPSDRIFLQEWLRAIANDLKEGLHYSIMFYGGKLLSHLSANDSEMDDFIAILPLCRVAAVIMDSDYRSGGQHLRTTKVRIQKELATIKGFEWVTAGREIENYFPRAARERAVKKVHPSAVALLGNRTRYEPPLAFVKADKTRIEAGFDKVGIAKALTCEGMPRGQMDFDEKIDALVEFIRIANR